MHHHLMFMCILKYCVIKVLYFCMFCKKDLTKQSLDREKIIELSSLAGILAHKLESRGHLASKIPRHLAFNSKTFSFQFQDIQLPIQLQTKLPKYHSFPRRQFLTRFGKGQAQIPKIVFLHHFSNKDMITCDRKTNTCYISYFVFLTPNFHFLGLATIPMPITGCNLCHFCPFLTLAKTQLLESYHNGL